MEKCIVRDITYYYHFLLKSIGELNFFEIVITFLKMLLLFEKYCLHTSGFRLHYKTDISAETESLN